MTKHPMSVLNRRPHVLIVLTDAPAISHSIVSASNVSKAIGNPCMLNRAPGAKSRPPSKRCSTRTVCSPPPEPVALRS